MAVNGKCVVELLKRPDVVHAFADSTNPIDVQVIDNLGFLTNIDIHAIKRDYEKDGPTRGGATLRQCLIHRYNDNEELNLQQFIDGLDNVGHVQLKKILLSAYNTSQGASQGLVADKQLPIILKKMKDYYIRSFSKYVPSPLAESFSIKDVWVNLSFHKGLSKLKSGPYLTMLRQAHKEDQLSLLIGQPGEGKTMTMKRIAFDWANDSIPDYDLVLCVPLRGIHEGSNTIFDMALEYMQNQNILKDSDVSYLRTLQDCMIGQPKMREVRPTEVFEDQISFFDTLLQFFESNNVSIESNVVLQTVLQGRDYLAKCKTSKMGEEEHAHMVETAICSLKMVCKSNISESDLQKFRDVLMSGEVDEEFFSIFEKAIENMQLDDITESVALTPMMILKDALLESKMEDNDPNQLHILIILDGYDEFRSDIQCKELNQLLFNRDLPNLDYCVLVTSRPYSVENIHAAAPKLIIEPLDMIKQTTYMFQHFKHESPGHDHTRQRVTKVRGLLSQNPSLKELAKVPLMLCFICTLSDKLTPTDDAVQLLKLLLNEIVERYESTMNPMRRVLTGSMRGIFKEPFHNICGKSTLIYNLGQMALTGLFGNMPNAPDKLQFTEDDLNNFDIDGGYCSNVGFLNFQLQGRFDEKIYEFANKTMQEFFAALLLFHELLQCEEIEIVGDKQNPIVATIKNRDRLFQHHPFLNQVFNTTKLRHAFDQLFCFLLEMSADSYKNNDQLPAHQLLHHSTPAHTVPDLLRCFVCCQTGTHEKRFINIISFSIVWACRNINLHLIPSISMFQPLIKHLSNCSKETKIYGHLVIILKSLMVYVNCDSQELLRCFSTCNNSLYRVGDDCIYNPNLDILFITDQSMINPISISYEQLKLKMRVSNQFWTCFVDSTTFHVLEQVCKEIDCDGIYKVQISISGVSPAVNHSNSQLLEQKIPVEVLHFVVDFDISIGMQFFLEGKSFDSTQVGNSCASLFTDAKSIRFLSRRNTLQVIGLDQLLGQSDFRNSVESIELFNITFPNEQTVVLLTEQLQRCRSLNTFITYNPDDSIGEQYLFILLDRVKKAGVSNLQITDNCLQKIDVFHKICSLLEQWHHLRNLCLLVSLPSDYLDILCNTLSQLPDLERLLCDVKEKHINRLKETNPNLFVEYIGCETFI